MKSSSSQIPFATGAPALIWQILFFYLPLALIALSSFIQLSETGEFEGLTLSHLTNFLTPTYMKVIGSSLLLAFSNACLCFMIGYPLAYFLAFSNKKYKNLLLFLLIVPFWTNFLLHIYAWFYLLEHKGLINQLLMSLGIIDTPAHLINSRFAIMIMMVYYYLPFMVLPLYSSLEKFNYSLIEASLDLGASWSNTVRRVLLPLTSPGIRAGFFLVYIPSFGEFAIPELMGGDKFMFVGSVVAQYILGEGTGSLGSAFTLLSCAILLVSAILLFLAIGWILNPRRHRV